MKAGIDLYCSQGAADALKLSGHRLHIVEAKKRVDIGPWRVLPFDVAHDAVESLGFLLAKRDEKLMFAMDTCYVPYRFAGLTHIMLGVNYSVEILRENVRAGRIDPALANRILRNHMSLETALEFFRANDMSQVQEIHLLHLSDANSDEERFKTEIARVTGRPVYVAKREDV